MARSQPPAPDDPAYRQLQALAQGQSGGGVDPNEPLSGPMGILPEQDDDEENIFSSNPFAESLRRDLGLPAQGPRGQDQLYTRSHVAQFPGESRERIAERQQQMAAAGLLQGEFQMGRARPGDNTHKAWEELLRYSNMTGQQWTDALSDLDQSQRVTVDDDGNIVPADQADQPEPRDFVRGRFLERDFVQDPFMQPDHDELTQRIRQVFRQELGRPPGEREIGHYVANLAQAEREAYDANIAASRAQFEAEETARERQFARQQREEERVFGQQQAQQLEGVEAGDIGAVGEPAGMPGMEQPGAVPDVNPVAQFREQFRRDYANTLERRTKLESGEAGRESLMGSILSIDQAIRGA